MNISASIEYEISDRIWLHCHRDSNNNENISQTINMQIQIVRAIELKKTILVW